MADGIVQLPTDSTGKKVDTEELTVGGNTVERERVQIAGSAATEVARVQATAPAGSEQALVTRNIPSGIQAVTSGTAKTLKRVIAALTVTGDVIAAVATKKLKVYAYAMQSRNASMTVQLRDGGSGSLVSLRWALGSAVLVVTSAITPDGFLFTTTAGNALQAVITGTGTIDIEVSYWDDDTT